MGFVTNLFKGTNSDVPTVGENPLNGQNYSANINTGLQNYGTAQQGQMGLAQQLQALASGQGPNPATSMLANAQGQNAQQAAGVYANNRAINPALAARQASNIQQQASGQAANQAATLQAQQQIAAQQNLGGLYNQMANQGLNLYGTATGGYNNAAGINAGIASGNQQATQNSQGAGMSALGAAAMAFLHGGGMVKGFDSGGMAGSTTGPSLDPTGQFDLMKQFSPSINASESAPSNSFGDAKGPLSNAARALSESNFGANQSGQSALERGGSTLGQGIGSAIAKLAASKGGKIPGKASKPGNSPKNDTVPAMLSPGEIVIPRTVVNSKDPGSSASKFVEAVLARESLRRGKGKVQ